VIDSPAPIGHLWMTLDYFCPSNAGTQKYYQSLGVYCDQQQEQGEHDWFCWCNDTHSLPRNCGVDGHYYVDYCPNYPHRRNLPRASMFCKWHEQWAWKMEYGGPKWTPARLEAKKDKLKERKEEFHRRRRHSLFKASIPLHRPEISARKKMCLGREARRRALSGLALAYS
jgi:hypothetical protein